MTTQQVFYVAANDWPGLRNGIDAQLRQSRESSQDVSIVALSHAVSTNPATFTAILVLEMVPKD